MSQIIIGIAGDNETGKSTLARALGDHYKFEVPYSGVADEIRYFVAQQYHVPLDICFAKPTPPWLRDILIFHGAQHRADGDRFYWANRWIARIGKRSTAVGDIRFTAEAEIIQSRKGILVFLGDPTDPNYELPELFQMADIRLPIKPDFTPELVIQFDRLLRSRGHDL